MSHAQMQREAAVRVYHGNYRPLAERFWEKVDKRGSDECWPWTGGLHEKGYGRISVNGVSTGAHVVAFYLEHGRWPSPGMQPHHTCFFRACCNMKHLKELTEDENKRARRALSMDPVNVRRRERRALTRQGGGRQ